MKKILILPIITAILALLIAGCGGGGGAASGGGGKTITISITPPSSLLFNGTAYNGATGVDYDFGATVGGASDTSVSWSVTTISDASTTGASIAGSGVFNASSPGTYKVIAASVADPSEIASLIVSVTGIEMPPPPPVQGASTSSSGSGIPPPPPL